MTENVTHINFFITTQILKKIIIKPKVPNKSGPDFLTVQYTHCVLIDRLK